MAIHGLSVLVILALLPVPTSAARPSLSDEVLDLDSQISAQGDGGSGAAGQEGAQVQNKSLTAVPSEEDIRLVSASAAFGTTVYEAFAMGGQMASFQGIGAGVIQSGLQIWAKQLELQRLRQGLCWDFMTGKANNGERFEVQMQRVWDTIIVPRLVSEAEGADKAKLDGMTMIAKNWLLYMETFFNVLAYVTAHKDICDSKISDIQRSWNDIADGTMATSNSYEWEYEFHWWEDLGTKNFGTMYPSGYHQRPGTMSGMKTQLETGTTWNPFRSTSALDRIINVATSLGIYDEAGKVTAPECLPPPPSFEDFTKQAEELARAMGGPPRISTAYLMQLWDASAGGEPSRRVPRAVNSLLVHLEKGEVEEAGEGVDALQVQSHGDREFRIFVQQAEVLARQQGGPSKIRMEYLKQLWSASEAGRDDEHVRRAINLLLPQLQNGDVEEADEGVEDDTDDFEEFAQQAEVLSGKKISATYLKQLWGATEAGDPADRMVRAMSMLFENLDAVEEAGDHVDALVQSHGDRDFRIFAQQAEELSGKKISATYLRRLWGATEAGDPADRMVRAMNMLFENPDTVEEADSEEVAEQLTDAHVFDEPNKGASIQGMEEEETADA